MADSKAAADKDKDAAQPQAEPTVQQPDVSLEGDDTFEEFASQDSEDAAAKEEERAELWQADWDDEDTTEDFQAKLRSELERHAMKD